MSKSIRVLLAAACVSCGFYSTGGCQTSRSTTDKTTLTGAHKHEETTTTRNPITGDVSTSTSSQTTR